MQQAKDRPIFGYSVAGDDPVVVAIRGEVDVSTAPELSAVLEDLTASNRHIVLDLGDVEFMDSTGLHVLEKAMTALQKVAGRLQVSSASDRVRRVFELSGMDVVLPLPDRSDGEAS